MAHKRKRITKKQVKRQGQRRQSNQTARAEQTPLQAETDERGRQPNEQLPQHIEPARHLASFAAHQDSLGNSATVALLQRQEHAEAEAGPVGADNTGHRIIFNGTEYYLTAEQHQVAQAKIAHAMGKAVRVIRRSADLMKWDHARFTRFHGWVGGVSDFFAGVEFPDESMWDASEPYLVDAELALESGHFDIAADRIAEAETIHNQAEIAWRDYHKATGSAAQATADVLAVTRDISFATAGALAGAVAAPVGLLASAGISAGSSMFFKGVEELATQTSEMGHHMREGYDPFQMIKSVGVAGLTGFAGALVSGPLAQKFFTGVLGGLSDDAARTIAVELSEDMGEEVTVAAVREMFEGSGPGLLAEFISESVGSAAAMPLTEAIKAAFQRSEADEEDMTPEKFIETIVEEFLKPDIATLFVTFAKSRLRSGM